MTVSLGLAAMAVSVQAATVSWNVVDTTTVQGLAGVHLADNWSNSNVESLENLQDDSGIATTIDVAFTYTAGNIWDIGAEPGVDTDGSWNRNMLNSYLNVGSGNTSTVTLSDIAYGSYDIYVYFGSDVAGRVGTITVGGTTYSFNTIGPSSVSGSNAVFAAADSGTTTADAANYAVFSGLSGATQTATVDINSWGGISGIQIVQSVPEPSSAALLGLAGLALILRRRK